VGVGGGGGGGWQGVHVQHVVTTKGLAGGEVAGGGMDGLMEGHRKQEPPNHRAGVCCCGVGHMPKRHPEATELCVVSMHLSGSKHCATSCGPSAPPSPPPTY
jgi:hypothetical protein